MTTLDLSFKDVGDAGVALLADAMRSNRSITLLTIADNGITDLGMAALAAAIDVSAD